MNKCLRITVTVEQNDGVLHTIVQRNARACGLEGIVQPMGERQIQIIVCGKKTNVDDFIDLLHKEPLYSLEIEPFSKDRDYRGVFRVIE